MEVSRAGHWGALAFVTVTLMSGTAKPWAREFLARGWFFFVAGSCPTIASLFLLGDPETE